MITKSHIMLISAVALLALSACSKDSSKNDAVVATVNGTPIKASRVDMMLKQAMAQGQPDSPELRKRIIENLGLQATIVAEAVKKGFDKKPETIEQVELIRQSILANAYIEDYIKTNPVSDDMIKAEYEKIKALRGGNEYKARHILLAKESEAKEVIAKLKKDMKSFTALAKAKSTDPTAKSNGGDLGWFDAQRMVPEFGAAVKTLEKGKMTETPVKSQFGYHVIILDDIRPVQFPDIEQVKDQLKQQVQQQNLQKFIEDMKAKAKIEYVGGAPAPAPAPAASVPAPAPQPVPAGK